MSITDFLLTLSQQFETDTIAVQPAACLNARFRGADCTRCADICPAETAIAVTNGQPAISNDACLHCGLCLHRCPTGAFIRPDGFSRKLIRTAAIIPTGPIELICPQHPNPTLGATPHAIQTHRCLATISSATLLELITAGKDIGLDDSYCIDCPLGAVQPELTQTAAEANSWGALLEDVGAVYLRSEQPDTAAVTRQLFDAARPPLSRRSLFGAIKPQTAPAVDTQTEATALIKPGRNISPVDRLPQSLPPERASILNILSSRTQASPKTVPRTNASLLPVAAVQVDPTRCTACGLCAKFCPTGAIKFLSDGESFALTICPETCLGLACNICRLACPEQAVITTTPVKVTPAVLSKRSLIAGELTYCDRCRTPIAHGPNLSTTCFACRPRSDAADFFTSFSSLDF